MQNLFTKLALVLLLGALGSGVTTVVNAQTGTIRGQVMDGEFNEPLIGATVVLEGTTIGANTDIDGQFAFNNVPVGTYTVKISYVSYETLSITDVVVEAGKVTVVEPVLKPAESSVGEVVITAKALAVSEASLLNLQIKAAQTLDGLGSRQISRIGDSDAGGAIRRVVGVTVEGGKYVYVRGLGDRYGKTLVNGAEIPGLDPTRNSVQIDLFPTNVLDNLVIYKAFTPDLPGSFTGGLVDITTRDFPDQFTLQVSVSASYNTQSTFNDEWLNYEGSNKDWLGLGFKDRDIPQFVRDNPSLTSPDAINQALGLPSGEIATSQLRSNINRVTEEFGPTWVPTPESAPLDHNFSFSLGNQKTLFGKPLGFIFGVSYRRQYNHFEGTSGIFNRTPQGVFTFLDVDDTKSSNDVLWSALGNVSIKLNDFNKLSLNLIRTQSGESTARFLTGLKPENQTEEFQDIRILDYNQRSNTIFQLRGSHSFGEKSFDIEWLGALAFTENFQPDFRTWAFRYTFDETTGEQLPASIDNTTTGIPIRFFRELDETNIDVKVHFTKYFNSWTGTSGKFKFGGAYLNKLGRKFSERQYDYNIAISTNDPRNIGALQDTPAAFFADPNNDFRPEDGTRYGFAYTFFPNFVNDYTAEELIYAAYAMFDFEVAPKLRLVTGVRYETTQISVIPDEAFFAASTDPFDGDIQQEDFLPAANLIYSLNEKSNLRLNYGRTLARPVFREIAPFNQFDFFGGARTVGNNALDRSLIDNLDFRYEYFPTTTEVIAVSAYYKSIQKPIEKAQLFTGSNPIVTWQNVDNAVVYGAEVDFRKNLGFISPALNRLSFGFNGSLTFSEVDVPQSEIDRYRQTFPNDDIPTTRDLYAQSDYVVNANLTYLNETTGSSYTVAFNRFGERLILVANPGTPNYFEQPRNSLDINIQQKLGGEDGRYTVRIAAQNVLNPAVRWTSTIDGVEYDWLNYKEGARFTLGLTYAFTK
ncbi:MAG: TonB-dependent receptor [Bacteroidia bacterium]|nr:TonB-dependent receptor [Bacteroidia bacterium]